MTAGTFGTRRVARRSIAGTAARIAAGIVARTRCVAAGTRTAAMAAAGAVIVVAAVGIAMTAMATTVRLRRIARRVANRGIVAIIRIIAVQVRVRRGKSISAHQFVAAGRACSVAASRCGALQLGKRRVVAAGVIAAGVIAAGRIVLRWQYLHLHALTVVRRFADLRLARNRQAAATARLHQVAKHFLADDAIAHHIRAIR